MGPTIVDVINVIGVESIIEFSILNEKGTIIYVVYIRYLSFISRGPIRCPISPSSIEAVVHTPRVSDMN